MENFSKQIEDTTFERIYNKRINPDETIRKSRGFVNGNGDGENIETAENSAENEKRFFEIIDKIVFFLLENQELIDEIMGEQRFAADLADAWQKYGIDLREKTVAEISSFQDVIGSLEANLAYVKNFKETSDRRKKVAIENLRLARDYLVLLKQSPPFESSELHGENGYGGWWAKKKFPDKKKYYDFCKEKWDKEMWEKGQATA